MNARKSLRDIHFSLRDSSLTARIFRALLVGFFLNELTVAAAQMIDTLFISRFLGNDAAAGMVFFFSYRFGYELIMNLVAGGIGIVGSALIGKMQIKEANRAYSTAGSWLLTLSVVLAGLTCVLIGPLTDIFCGGATEAVRGMFRDYTMMYAAGLPAIFLNALMFPLLQLDGENRRCRIAVAATTVTNILGDVLLVRTADMGMTGIALATVISQYTATVIMGLHFVKGKSQIRLRFTLRSLKDIGKICGAGLPGSSTYLCCLAYQMIYNGIVLKYGGVTGAAALSIFMNLVAPFKELCICLVPVATTVMGVYRGEEDAEGIRDFLKITLKYVLIVVNAAAAVLFFTAPLLTELFKAGEAAEKVVFITRCYAAGMGLHACVFFVRGYLPAVKAFGAAVVCTVLAELVCPVGITWIFAPRWGFKGIGYAVPVTYLVFVLLCLIGYRVMRRVHPGKRIVGFRAADFGITDAGPETTAGSIEEAVAFSRETYDFCSGKVDDWKAYRASLAAEELGRNIFEHGVQGKGRGKKPGAEMRVRIKGGRVILSLRDTGKQFNPKDWNEKAAGSGMETGLGIRMALTGAEVEYVNTFGMNMIMITV